MVSGVVVVRIEGRTMRREEYTRRILVLNARDVQMAVVTAVRAFMETLPPELKEGRPAVENFIRVDFDTIA